MHERRKLTRWQAAKDIKVRLEGAHAFADGKLLDINLKGMQISLKLKFAKDSHLKMQVVLADDFTLVVEAWVAWQRAIDGYHIYGLCFTKLKDEDKDRIYKFVFRHFPYEIHRQLKKDLILMKGGETMDDRRVFERIPARLDVRYLDINSGKDGQAVTRDISAKGVGLVTSAALTARTPLELWLDVPDKGEPIYTRGEVAWSTPAAGGVYHSGISLERADLMGFSRVLRAA